MVTTLDSPVKSSLKSVGAVGRFYTPAEYLALEEKAETKSEYKNGVIVPMAGASIAHSRITARIIIELGNQLSPDDCTIYTADTRIRVTTAGLYTYPDVSVSCGEQLLEGATLLNPSLVVEVLSDSTEAYDRGDKFARYQQLDSLTDYILVSQTQPRIEHYAARPMLPGCIRRSMD